MAALIEQPVKYGTGASLLIGFNPTPLDGKVVITPLVPGPVKIKFSTFTGSDTALSAAVANTTEITVTPGTNTDSQPTVSKDSATQLKAAIDAVAQARRGAVVRVGEVDAGCGHGASEEEKERSHEEHDVQRLSKVRLPEVTRLELQRSTLTSTS